MSNRLFRASEYHTALNPLTISILSNQRKNKGKMRQRSLNKQEISLKDFFKESLNQLNYNLFKQKAAKLVQNTTL